ncbi:MAG: zinc ribbon domain-containing protein [Candidatus Eisenbacteria bacterium]|nr:zinc ribbon domain-containing protein [Candidatus Eisenbacteria bacterium]
MVSDVLKNCPYPKCDHVAGLGDQRYCPDCKGTVWRCAGCGSTNQVFATYCRGCGRPLTQGADSWTHHARCSMRDSYQSLCAVKEGPGAASVALIREADFSCEDDVEAGLLIAYGMVYVTTASGRVIALDKEDLALQKTWAAPADAGYHSTPVIQGHSLFLAGSRILTRFRLRGSIDPQVIHELPEGWQFGRHSLVACEDYLAATCFGEGGRSWKVLVFRPGDSERFELGWESEPFVDCQGLLMPLIVSSQKVLVLITGTGGVYQFRPLELSPCIAANAHSSPSGFCPSIHPAAQGNYVFLIAGSPPHASLVSIYLATPSLTTNLVRSLEGFFPHGLTLAANFVLVSLADGFSLLSGNHPICLQDHPKELLQDAAVALGQYTVFSSATCGLLHPYRFSCGGVDRLDPYPRDESPSGHPYVSVVPGSSEIIAVRRDGVVHRLAFKAGG